MTLVPTTEQREAEAFYRQGIVEMTARISALEAEVARYKRKLMQGEAVLAGWTRLDRIKLATGEMTAQEARTALAVAMAIAASVRSAIAAEPDKGGSHA